MTPSCFLWFWCGVEILAYLFSMLVIAAFLWTRPASNGGAGCLGLASNVSERDEKAAEHKHIVELPTPFSPSTMA